MVLLKLYMTIDNVRDVFFGCGVVYCNKLFMVKHVYFTDVDMP